MIANTSSAPEEPSSVAAKPLARVAGGFVKAKEGWKGYQGIAKGLPTGQGMMQYYRPVSREILFQKVKIKKAKYTLGYLASVENE